MEVSYVCDGPSFSTSDIAPEQSTGHQQEKRPTRLEHVDEPNNLRGMSIDMPVELKGVWFGGGSLKSR